MRSVDSAASESDNDAPFRVGDWVVRPAHGRLDCAPATATRASNSVVVGPRLMAVLVCLARSGGEPVSRRVLLDTVWSDVVVNEDALTRAVSELRRILGDDPANPSYISTIRGRGYLLLPDVLPVNRPPVDSRRDAPTQDAKPPARSLPLALAALAMALILALAFLARPRGRTDLLEATPLTSFVGRETDAELSPDGSTVVFSWSGPRRDNYDVYLKHRLATQPLRLTSDPALDFHPTWSPAGDRVAFVRTIPRDAGPPEHGIYSVPVLGGEAVKLSATTHWSRGLDWSPDGKYIIYCDRDARGPYRMYLLDTRTGNSSPLAHSDGQHSDHSPRFSSDGKYVAFVRDEAVGDLENVFVVPTAGGEPEPITDALDITGFDWLPDRRHVVVAAVHAGVRGLWRVPLRRGPLEWIPVLSESVAYPSVARQANRLVYERTLTRMNVWQLSLSAEPGSTGIAVSRVAPLLVSTMNDAEAAYSSDGGRIAFVSTRTGEPEIFVASRDGTGVVQVTFSGPNNPHGPQWSPTGDQIAFYARDGKVMRIFVVNLTGTEPRAVSVAGTNAVWPTWSRDGAWVYYTSDFDGGWRLWRQRLEDGLVELVAPVDGFLPRESPDGRRLYFTRLGTAGIWSVQLDGGTAEQVIKDVDPGYADSWALSGGEIFYVQQSSASSRLVRYDLRTGRLTLIDAGLRVTPAPGGISVSPDGGSVLFSVVEETESDLMMVDGVW